MLRRDFLRAASATTLLSMMGGLSALAKGTSSEPYEISLSQWSFHRAIFGNSREDYARFIAALHSDPDSVLQGDLDPRDIVVRARELGVSHVDLVNILWFGHARDRAWLRDSSQRARDHDVAFVCLMCDELGYLGSSDSEQRRQAIENHKPWLACAAELGCTQVRVNAYGDGTYLEQLEQNAESMAALAELAEDQGVELLVENHGHPSSNAAWLAMLIEKVSHPNLGVYADLDNFFMGGWNIVPERRYDRRQGLLDLAPYTRGVSAKTHAFTEDGQETTIDYVTSMKVFADHGFSGFASAEYEGNALSEYEGTQATIALLKATRQQLG